MLPNMRFQYMKKIISISCNHNNMNKNHRQITLRESFLLINQKSTILLIINCLLVFSIIELVLKLHSTVLLIIF